ncbi:killer cell lectin-like receptor 2 [Psammomys obesus]|uniref:killer cell lectin-like receptor 2 n=1 Tax=Psammomys obesus TaxID=48139 RepID=UPI002452A116|nr:killer cell lectin-like receptor 2 [Psammomys obesus]
MSDRDITYTTVRFHKSSGLQNRVRHDETQGSREAGYRKCSVSWKLIVIPLGIFCSLLLVTVAVLVTHIFQEKHEQENILNNLHQENYTLKSNISLKEQMLKNKSIEIDYLKGQLDFLKRQRNRCHEETQIILGCSQPTGKCVEGRWFCCGIKCYYLIKDDKPWSECSQTCQDCSLSLLKIDDAVELNFLKPKFYQKKYWIGLRRNRTKRKWQWIDDVPSNLDLAVMDSLRVIGDCAFLSSTGIHDDDCGRVHSCICGKR